MSAGILITSVLAATAGWWWADTMATLAAGYYVMLRAIVLSRWLGDE